MVKGGEGRSSAGLVICVIPVVRVPAGFVGVGFGSVVCGSARRWIDAVKLANFTPRPGYC